MQASRFPSGVIKAGFIPMIRAAGSSGIAATTWAAECRRGTPARSGAGKRSGGTSRRSRSTANRVTRCAGRVSVKLYCSGPTIAAPYENAGAGLRACIFRLTGPGQFDILLFGFPAGGDPMPFDQLHRRAFIAVLGGGAAAWPLAARAQQPAMPVIGFLAPLSTNEDQLCGFRQGLKQAGFLEGENVSILYRSAENEMDKL